MSLQNFYEYPFGPHLAKYKRMHVGIINRSKRKLALAVIDDETSLYQNNQELAKMWNQGQLQALRNDEQLQILNFKLSDKIRKTGRFKIAILDPNQNTNITKGELIISFLEPLVKQKN